MYQKPTRLTDGATTQNIYKVHADKAVITNRVIKTHLYRSRHTHPQIRLQTSKQTKRIIWWDRAPPYPWTNIYICNERIYIPKCRLRNKRSTPNSRRGCPKLVDHQTVRLYLRAWNAAPRRKGVSTKYVLSMQSRRYRKQIWCINEIEVQNISANPKYQNVYSQNISHA